ncbi:MobP1 family relaxase [Aliarcobacter butzleri]|uniref:MobP1 family relaxase n=1 Tax=Aliarcobacter butzleri TaxID=28197 RepID=UPI001EDB84BB|nr:MobP1 family relaxase [Aliarcobacter butzleri]MCG3693076.1 spore coat protein CotH [Aliarcobacter butzleri]
MTKRMKVFDEDELRAKKVFTRIERNSKSAYNYTKKINKDVKRPIVKNTPRGKEVVIKITGNSKNFQQWKAHFRYVTRRGELEVVEDELHKYQGKEELKKFQKIFNDTGENIPNENQNKRPRREVLNFVFSMKEHEKTPQEKFMSAVLKTIKEKYPNNGSYAVFHGDTDNPHIHCYLKIAGIDGNRIDVRKKDLEQLRKEFAKNLNDLGIEAYATRKYEKYNLDKNIDTSTQDKIKNHHYEVSEFGKAKYKFDDKNSESYFVSYKTKGGDITTIWGKELENVIKDNNIVPGEFVKFKKVDKTPVETVIRKKSKNGKREVYKKTSFKDVWDCSILGRAEKDLIVNPNIKDKKVSYNYEEQQLSDIEKKNAQFLKMKKEREAKQGLNISSNVKGNKFSHLKKKDDLER